MNPVTRNILIFFLFISICASCSSTKIREEEKDTKLFQEAEIFIEEEEYKEAIDTLKKLIESNPSSPLLENAYFEIGRAYYLDQQNVDAEVAIDDFIRLYPDSKLIPKALLLKGKTIERDKEKPGRDQSFTENAIEIYTDIVEKYPESDEAKEASSRIQTLSEYLAKHEFKIAKFYYKTKKYESAEKRLKLAFQKYSHTETAPGIIELLAETYLREGKKEEAHKLWEFMEKHYPNREETKTLRKEIEGAAK